MYAQITYSAVTRCYYGEVIGPDYVIAFQARFKQDVPAAMYAAVDQFLARRPVEQAI